MHIFKSIFASNRNFFFVFALFFVSGLILLLTEGRAGTFLLLNPYHRQPLDQLFGWVTFLGDGLFSVLVIVLLLCTRRFLQAFQVLAAFLVSALFAQILKNAFSMPRPKQFFMPGVYGHFIQGVTLTGFASFPSGHSTSIFALATMLALFEKNKKWNVVYLLGAIAVGYSRIYLGQHFLQDVLAGSVIGMLVSVLVHWIFLKKFPSLRASTLSGS